MASRDHNRITRALLVEGNDIMRSVATGQLRDAGAHDVVAVSRISAARERLEREHFDLVMCSREFTGKEESGQDLLDELRRENLLPPDTVFIMVAAGATYQEVADAGEASIDTFLVRPYTTEALSQRLKEAIQRRRALSPIFSALQDNDPGRAFMHALMRFQQGQRYAMYAGRLAAEMLLRFHRPEDAQTVFARIAQRQPSSWAELGIARALSASGDLTAAREAIAAIQQRDPNSADAHELMGQILIEHGELTDAQEHYLRAAALTPGCVMRAQIGATLSFYLSSPAQAVPLLERTCRLGARSRLLNPLTWVLLGFARLTSGDAKAVGVTASGLNQWIERNDAVERGAFWVRVMRVLDAFAQRSIDAAVAGTRELTLMADQDSFNLESANVLLSLWNLVPDERWPAPERLGQAQSMGLRLGVSKAVTELMCAAAGTQEDVRAALRQAQNTIALYSQRCVQRSMGAGAIAAVTQLLEQAETTRNARLFELAGLTLKRHATRISDPAQLADLAERAGRGLRQYAHAVSHIAGVQRAGRSAGGLPLRGWNHESALKALMPSLQAVEAALQQGALTNDGQAAGQEALSH
jgi:CheY-like chemotaxis protein